MGSIRVRDGGGNLFFDFRYQGKRCREQTLLPDTPANRKKLEMLLDRIEREIKANIFNYAYYFPNSPRAAEFDANQAIEQPSDTPLFKVFCWLWFEENTVRWKPSYTQTQRIILEKYLVPQFGGQVVGKISKSSILQYRASLARIASEDGMKLSPDRINHIMTPLRMILDEASERFGFSTPFRNIKPLKVQASDVEPFSLPEVQLIIEHAPDEFKEYYLIRFFTGMRTSEIDGLKWQYVNIEKRQIMIRETIVDGIITNAKTAGSHRVIEMSIPVMEAFKRLRELAYPTQEFVFINRMRKPLDHRNVTKRVWYPLLEKLNLKYRTPYQTRHTAATLWLAAGESPEWIARQMGHTTTRMLFTVYSRYVPNLTRQDGSAMERLLAREGFMPSDDMYK